MSTRPIVYISGPITADTPAKMSHNVELADEKFRPLFDAGFAVHCPHWSYYSKWAHSANQRMTHEEWMANDLPIMERYDAILRLPGYSKGADMECEHARLLGIPVYVEMDDLLRDRDNLAEKLLPLKVRDNAATLPHVVSKPTSEKRETVLEEAARITSGDRQRDYDHPVRNFARIADLWNAYLRIRKPGDLLPEDVGWMAILMKVARDVHTPKRDNPVDACGYARCIERIRAASGDPQYQD